MANPQLLDFGLDAQQEARARDLHESCLIFDGMNQHPGGPNIFDELPGEWIAEKLRGLTDWEALVTSASLPYMAAQEGVSNVIEDWWRQSGVDVGSWSVPTNPAIKDKEMAGEIFGPFDWISMVTTVKEMRENKEAGRISLWGIDQPVMGIPNRLDAVDDAFGRGLRSLMLTYNRMDYVGVGCTERFDAGLSMFGIDVVKRCNDLGIIVDVSHCGHETTMDACRFSTRPVIANHSSAHGAFPHARAKNDEALRAIADSGGLVGVVTVPFFLSTDRRPRLDLVIDHVDYIRDLVGIDHVGLGTDWPMMVPRDVMQATLGGAMSGDIGFRPEDNIDTSSTFEGFDDYREMINITRALVARGYPDDDIAKVLGENHLRVIEQVCG